jgi:hypothetical protein
MQCTDLTPLDRLLLGVEDMIDAGNSFGEVEDAIEATDLSDDQKSAVWLLAWSALGPQAQEREARVKLALVR